MPGRRRYDHVAGKNVTVGAILFATSYNEDGSPITLSLWHGVVLTAPLVNGYSTIRVPTHPWTNVCLGPKAARLIEQGRLDPVEAYWMTGSFESTFVAAAINDAVSLNELHQTYQFALSRYYLTG